MKKILLLMAYLGKWPEWINLFIESCRYNPTIDWLFFTDCGEPENKCKNVRYIRMTIEDFNKLASSKLGIDVFLKNSYKLCDFKPALGKIFEDYLKGYDYFGYGDIDVIYGDMRKLITDDILKYDLISFQQNLVSGHLSLFRNSDEMREKYLKIRNWKQLLKDPSYRRLDEDCMYDLAYKGLGLYRTAGILLKRHIPRLFNLLRKIKVKEESLKGKSSPFSLKVINKRFCFIESFSTPFGKDNTWLDGTKNYPNEWYWEKGRLTNNKDKGIEFIYLHFMVWKGGANKNYNLGGQWESLKRIVNFDSTKPIEGFKINEKGFFRLNKEK